MQSHEEASIGAWQLCLEMIGVVACMTNLLLAVMVSENVTSYVPKTMSEQLGSFEGKVRSGSSGPWTMIDDRLRRLAQTRHAR